jgi:hypothetical protein
MKKQLLLLIFAMSIHYGLFGQFVNGTIMPNWTMKDMNGKSWDLYTLLNEGKSVVLDMSATWCGPCWNYHNGHQLKTFYEQYGPTGTIAKDKAMVFLFEVDCGTNDACITNVSGCTGSTQGNWTTNTTYPILNPAKPSCGDITKPYQVPGYPNVYMVCPDKKGYKLGQPTAASLASTMNKNCTATTDIISSDNMAASFSISPNPSKEVVNVFFNLSGNTTVELSVYDMLGNKTKTILSSRQLNSGEYSYSVDISSLASGAYLCKLNVEGVSVSKILVKQ